MRFKKTFLFFFAAVFCWGAVGEAQQWSGIIAPSRAVDWSQAGIPGGVPNRTTICATLNPGATAAQINSAIASCPSGQVVYLNAGTYNLSAGISFAGKSNVTLRGAGADKTLLVFSGNVNCRGFGSSVCIASSSNPGMPTPSNTATWTAGYAKGTTTITVGSTSGMSASNGTLLILDQQDDSSDNGTIYVCSACAEEGGNAYGRSGRAQQQIVRVTAVDGNNVTIAPGLHMPNWNSSKTPGVSWASGSVVSASGVEDLSMNHTNSGGQAGVVFLYGHNLWLKGVRSINANRNHIWMYQTAMSVVRDSYFYGTQNAASQSYGVETFSTSSLLIENNMFQHVTGPITINGADSGSVYSYNFAIDDYYNVSQNWMIASTIAHESGIAMTLLEGNSGLGFTSDIIHGSHHFITAFRNHWYGDTYNNPSKTNNTDLIHLWAFSRYYNIIGNVLGRSGYYNTYEVNLGGSPTAIFSLGDDATGVPTDATVKTTLMRWGNYDTVNNATRWQSSEVPSGLGLYANAVPSSQALPPSFYLSAKPNWFGGVSWPASGPDVTGGTGPAGHAYNIPAKDCYETSPIDSQYGSNNVRLFNAASCYGQSGGSVSVPTAPSTLSVQ
jgi:hypothetical protein